MKVLNDGKVKLATVGGRYYGMDRDKNYDRLEKAYEAMVKNIGPHYDDPFKALEESYDVKSHQTVLLFKYACFVTTPLLLILYS